MGLAGTNIPVGSIAEAYPACRSCARFASSPPTTPNSIRLCLSWISLKSFLPRIKSDGKTPRVFSSKCARRWMQSRAWESSWRCARTTWLNLTPTFSSYPHRLWDGTGWSGLRYDEALEAVTQPALNAGCPFAPGVAERLVEDLCRIKVQGDGGRPVWLPRWCWGHTSSRCSCRWSASDCGRSCPTCGRRSCHPMGRSRKVWQH